MKLTKVAVLRGGPSSEYDVSMQTGANVLQSLYEMNVPARDIVITRGGEWLVDGFVKQPNQALCDVDAVFIGLHGAYGEDGTVQRILERLRIPYTGSGPFASALAMNKQLTKEQVTKFGIKTPKGIKFSRENTADIRQAAFSLERLFGPHYVVKPINGGSSMHTSVVSGTQALHDALQKTFTDVETVLVEERIFGREATVGILEKYRGQPYYLLPTIEIVPSTTGHFFDTEAKYNGQTDEICPGRFTREESEALLNTAKQVHEILDLRHYSRSDFILTPQGVYFLEVNTLPGLTKQSLLPRSIEAVGGTYKELVTHLLNLATSDI